MRCCRWSYVQVMATTSAPKDKDAWTSDEDREPEPRVEVIAKTVKRKAKTGAKKQKPVTVKPQDDDIHEKKRIRRPDADSWSDDEDDCRALRRLLRPRATSSPPSFMSKQILRESKDKQDKEVKKKMRQLKDLAAPAPARTREEKSKLVKYFCADCESYYSTFPGRDASTSACRHRRVEARPATPPHYWQLDIPSSPLEPETPIAPSQSSEEKQDNDSDGNL